VSVGGYVGIVRFGQFFFNEASDTTSENPEF
jgi:hypothetical protein